MQVKYIFNPEHDLCLANGDANYVPPDSALQFGRECHAQVEEWLQGICPESEEAMIMPWGWDRVLVKRLLKEGTPRNLLPSEEILNRIRENSSRTVAAEAARHIKKTSLLPHFSEPVTASTMKEVEQAIARWPRCLLKSPLSGSGKGLRWVDREMSASDAGWCRRTLASMGCVMVERRYNILQDYAMLFRCNIPQGKGIEFFGYSLFYTKNGAYIGSIVEDDEFIEEYLCSFAQGEEFRTKLHKVRELLTEFLQERFGDWYTGFLGVDQFIYEDSILENGTEPSNIFINPAVEINLRLTMGHLFRHLAGRK